MLTSLVAYKAWCQRPRAPRLNGGALGGGSTAHEARLLKMKDHPMDKSHPVDETRIDAVERAKRQRRLNAKGGSKRAKAPKRQTRRKGGVGPRSRTKPATGKQTKQQACLDLLSRQKGATIEELQAATGWQQHSVRGFLAGAVRKKLGLTLLSEKPDDGPRRYRITDTV